MAAKKTNPVKTVESTVVESNQLSYEDLMAQLAALQANNQQLQTANHELQTKVVETEKAVLTMSVEDLVAKKKEFDNKEIARIESEVNTIKSVIDTLVNNESIASLIMDYDFQAITFKVSTENGIKTIISHYSGPVNEVKLGDNAKRNYTVINRWKVGNELYSGRGLPNKDIVTLVASHFNVTEKTASDIMIASKNHARHTEIMQYLDSAYGTVEYKAKKAK
jgi:hypothetical protein